MPFVARPQHIGYGQTAAHSTEPRQALQEPLSVHGCTNERRGLEPSLPRFGGLCRGWPSNGEEESYHAPRVSMNREFCCLVSRCNACVLVAGEVGTIGCTPTSPNMMVDCRLRSDIGSYTACSTSVFITPTGSLAYCHSGSIPHGMTVGTLQHDQSAIFESKMVGSKIDV